MKIKVYTIDVKLPRWLKKGMIVAAATAALGIGAVVWAQVAVDTSAIGSGKPISAGTIKTNFDNLASAVTTLQGTVSASAAGRSIFMMGTACVPASFSSAAVASAGTDGLWNPSSGASTYAICPVVSHGKSVSNLSVVIASNSAVTCTPYAWNGSAVVAGTAQSADPAGAFKDMTFNFGAFNAPAQISCTLPPNTGLRRVTWVENQQ